jgi:hypothetical protein
MAKHIGVASPASRSADFSSPIFVSSDSDGTDALLVFVDITSSGNPLTVSIKGRDLTSGHDYTILQSAALGSNGLTVLRVGAGLTAATNLVANDYVPDAWYVTATTASSGVLTTYSIGASWV